MQEKISITLELANAITQYLGTRPYQEVASLIAEIQKQYAEQLKEPKLEAVN
jgi:hypothetical protein